MTSRGKLLAVTQFVTLFTRLRKQKLKYRKNSCDNVEICENMAYLCIKLLLEKNHYELKNMKASTIFGGMGGQY